MEIKNRGKIIALTLILILSAVFAAGCKDGAEKTPGGNDPVNPAENAPEETTGDGLFYDKVPEFDLEGYEYKVVTGVYSRDHQELFPEEEMGDILNDTIYARNRKIEERFKMNFKSSVIGLFELLPAIRKNVKAGDNAFDMYMQIDREAYTAAGENLVYPLYKLPYIDLTQPYWCRLANEQLTLGGKQYIAFSDDNLSHFESAVVVYFNKKQVQDLGLEDIYALVKSGNWTHNKFYEYAKAAVKDLDGDGKITKADIWGMASEEDFLFPCFWTSAGLTLAAKDENDIPYFAVPGNEKFFNIAATVVAEINKSNAGICYIEQSSTEERVAFFRNGGVLFSVGSIRDMVQLRDMPDDFGIVPFPKYTAEQPQYYSRVCGGFPYVIPITCDNPELVGAVMEAMACAARNEIVPAYYEWSLQNKYSRDPDTVEMLDLIFDTRMYDLGDTIWYSPIRIGYTAVFLKGEDTFVSFTEKNEQKYRDAIEKSVNAILENG
ncbi:MAG: extracellular solute-binding protein [Oscillospiraceae bacterium]|nr:extracellular solute-binding protein [Oscillospiraceae bacterium]